MEQASERASKQASKHGVSKPSTQAKP